MDSGIVVAAVALALLSMAYGVSTAISIRRVRALEDENALLRETVQIHERLHGRMPIRLSGLVVQNANVRREEEARTCSRSHPAGDRPIGLIN